MYILIQRLPIFSQYSVTNANSSIMFKFFVLVITGKFDFRLSSTSKEWDMRTFFKPQSENNSQVLIGRFLLARQNHRSIFVRYFLDLSHISYC
mmetsp:Transcript_66662/g.98856  ORF Transcript_66662/g.98856 Transcript_66662/m.98856 type:complete len:93 (-) Transcript_66662:739-1017(-)